MAEVRKKIVPPLVGSDIVLVVRPKQNINQTLDVSFTDLVNSIKSIFSSTGGYVPDTRTLTINGVTYDLTQNRTWTISAGVSSVNGLTGAVVLSLGDINDVNVPTPSSGQVLQWNGTEWVAASVVSGDSISPFLLMGG